MEKINYIEEKPAFALLNKRLKEYEARSSKNTDIKKTGIYLRYILHYVYKLADNEAYPRFENYLMLASCHTKANGGSALINSAAEAAADYPDDDIFSTGPKLINSMTDKDMDAVISFLEWDVTDAHLKKDEHTKKDKESKESGKYHLYLGEIWGTYIFNESSEQRMVRLMMNSSVRDEDLGFLKKYTPPKIKAYLDRFIIGQEAAKKCVATAVYNHYLRLCNPEEKMTKPNVLMIGPTGCGKTEIMRRLKDIISVPVVISDLSRMVGSQWKGRHKEDIISELISQAGGNISLAERGIIFIDEFDKLASFDEKRGYAVKDELQGQLLGMFEGTVMSVPDPKDTDEHISINTENILFICAGAFEGLDKVVANDDPGSAYGFGMTLKKKTALLNSETLKERHLIKYGFKPELIGRFGEICLLEKLSDHQLRQVFDGVEDSLLSRYKNLFKAGAEKNILFTEDAIDELLGHARELNVGARSLGILLHRIMDDLLFDADSIKNTCILVDDDTVEKMCRNRSNTGYSLLL